jgi:arylsulfatase A-like enzyme
MRGAGIALATLLAASGCGDSRQGSAPLPNVILLSLDTLRADRIGCYGSDTSTPAIDALAAVSDRYASCTATAPWTLPSHASMLTGLYPFEHGTHGFRVDEFKDNVYPLHHDHTTLAEELQRAGYDTAAYVANTVYLAPRWGLSQGFDHYEVKRQPAAAVTDRVLARLDGELAASDAPKFLFVNYMDMHRPYGSGTTEEILRLPAEERPDAMLEKLCVRVMNDGEAPGELADTVLGMYDAALQTLDREVGRLMDGLKARGLWENSIVILTSDHGEAFGTHRVVEHGKDVYEPLVSVPLLVKYPGQTEGRVLGERLSSLVDLPGLVSTALPGEVGEVLRTSFPRVPGTHGVLSEIHFARPRDFKLYGERFQHERTSWRDGRFKLNVGGETTELFDLEADPGELVNLAESEPARTLTMRRALERFLQAKPYTGERLQPMTPNEFELKEAAQLGYGGK